MIFSAVAFPWYVAVQLRTPEFFRVFILENNVARFGTNLYRHSQPFWYYLPVAILELVPWIVLIIVAFFEIVRAWRAERRKLVHSEDSFSVFLVIWLLVPIVFFSISRSKLPGYVLLALPAGTLLATEFLRRHLHNRPGVVLALIHALVAAFPVVPALMIQYLLFQHHLPWGQATVISSGFAVALATGIFLTLRSQPGWKVVRFVTLIPVAVAVAALLRIGSPALDSTLSARPLANQIQHMENGVLPTAVFRVTRQTEYGLAFYRNQKITRYEAGEIPAVEHVVVAPVGSETAIAKLVFGRRVSYLGSYEPQGLDYYWVAGRVRFLITIRLTSSGSPSRTRKVGVFAVAQGDIHVNISCRRFKAHHHSFSVFAVFGSVVGSVQYRRMHAETKALIVQGCDRISNYLVGKFTYGFTNQLIGLGQLRPSELTGDSGCSLRVEIKNDAAFDVALVSQMSAATPLRRYVSSSMLMLLIATGDCNP